MDQLWDIHMELPYGTMTDDEMRALNVRLYKHIGLFFYGSMDVRWNLNEKGIYAYVWPNANFPYHLKKKKLFG